MRWPCNMVQNCCDAVTHILKATGFLLQKKKRTIILCDVSASHLTQEAGQQSRKSSSSPRMTTRGVILF